MAWRAVQRTRLPPSLLRTILHATSRTGALLTQTDYERLAAQLGADIPFSVRAALGQALALGGGTGTELQNIAAPREPLHLVIVAAQFGLHPQRIQAAGRGPAAGEYPASASWWNPKSFWKP